MPKKIRRVARTDDSPNRPKLERMQTIHMHLREGLDAGHMRDTAREKKNASFFAGLLETSPKTIHRDIAYMKDRMGLPIEYDAARNTYYYTKEVMDFPLIKITEGELTALFVAKAALHQYKGAPYEAALKSALEKLESGLKSEMEVDLDAIDRAISFRNAGSPVPDMKLFELLADAVMHRNVVTFTYRKGGKNGEESKRTVRPYHLTHYKTRWYLVAAEEENQDSVKQFHLRGISRAKTMGHRFAPPVGFSPDAYYQNSFGIFVSKDGEQEVKLRFSGAAAEVVLEGDWHPTQSFAEKKDGTVELTLRVSSLDEVAKWVLSFGGDAVAISPEGMREKVRTLAEKLMTGHRAL